MRLDIVSANQVSAAIAHWNCHAMNAEIPSRHEYEWQNDHRHYVLGIILPALNPPLKLWRIVAEAYLAGMETQSDGSSVVPDALRYGNTKDWQGVMHDYIFALHHAGRADAFGHVWELDEANRAYRDAWRIDAAPARGAVWYVGLTLGSWAVWRKRVQVEFV